MATRPIPPRPPETLIPAEVQAEISRCQNLGDISNLVTKWANEQISDGSRYAYPLRIGAAYRMATTARMFTVGRDEESRNRAKAENTELERVTGYSIGHLRSCARLYENNHLIDLSVEWYRDNKGKLKNTPRKAEGIDFAISCIKAYVKFIDSVKTMPADKAMEEADKTLPASERPQREPPPVNAAQLIERRDSVIVSLLVMLRNADSPLIVSWTTPEKLLNVITGLKYSDDESQLSGRIHASINAPVDDLVEATEGLLRYLNDNAQGIVDDDDEGGEDDGGNDPSRSPSSGGELITLPPDPPSSEGQATRPRRGIPGFSPNIVFSGDDNPLSGASASQHQAVRDAVAKAREIGHTGSATSIRDTYVRLVGDRRHGYIWSVEPPPIVAPDETKSGEFSSDDESTG